MTIAVCLVAAFSVLTGTASAQTQNYCAIYDKAVTTDTATGVPVVSEALLADWNAALPCLVRILRSLKDDVGPQPTQQTRSKMLSVTGALRNIILKFSDPNDPKKVAEMAAFIKAFRDLDDIVAVSVLTWGVRGDSPDLRSNSLLVLGNVIDNTTVCVPLTHLSDPTLVKSASGINGRANLLSLLSVVAPWAYKENSENIARTRASILGQVNSNDPNLKGTLARLENISKRLDDNTETSNRSVPMPESWRLQCKAYVEGFVPKLPSFQNVEY
ncbi:hypothetical protein [Bradyrhizobium sp.]|jgi:hypothetical protein|uniref:hypothetical protein n=1 Tax=Bradyrhizobium sp. TaxID=376 RepID=UPI002DF8E44B|nr:hypothetical protein [Bradyrhizobium sp.]